MMKKRSEITTPTLTLERKTGIKEVLNNKNDVKENK